MLLLNNLPGIPTVKDSPLHDVVFNSILSPSTRWLMTKPSNGTHPYRLLQNSYQIVTLAIPSLRSYTLGFVFNFTNVFGNLDSILNEG